MTPQKLRYVKRPDHPAAALVGEFHKMRDRCRYYHGIKYHDGSVQCSHPGQRYSWCALDCCPLVDERASYEGVGR